MISYFKYLMNRKFLPIGDGAPIFSLGRRSRHLRLRYNSTMQASVRTPKAPPMMGPISDFDFPCTGMVVTSGVARDVVLENDDGNDVYLGDREDCGVV
jgi:hypothetical protein